MSGDHWLSGKGLRLKHETKADTVTADLQILPHKPFCASDNPVTNLRYQVELPYSRTTCVYVCAPPQHSCVDPTQCLAQRELCTCGVT